jgi:hypothetical protein
MLAVSEFQLACCAPVADAIYVGTDDARVLRVRANGNVEELRSFEAVVSVKTLEQPGMSSRTASMRRTALPWRSWATTYSWRRPRTTSQRRAQFIDDL